MQGLALHFTVQKNVCRCTVYWFSMLTISTEWNPKSRAPRINPSSGTFSCPSVSEVYHFLPYLPTHIESYRGSASYSNSDRVAPRLCSVLKHMLLLVQITFKNNPTDKLQVTSGTEELSGNCNTDRHFTSTVSCTSAANVGHPLGSLF